MSHNQRLEELIKFEGLNSSKFCKSIGYTLKNLGNYLRGNTSYPNGELVIGILQHYPHWNLRYWLLGQGEMTIKDDKIVIFKEPDPAYKHVVVQELTKQLAFLRTEIERRDAIIEEMKNQQADDKE